MLCRMIAFLLSHKHTDRDTTHPKVSERVSVSQEVDMEQLAWFLSNDDINSRFHQLGFRILTFHERVYEGWDSNRKLSSEEFGKLEKYVASREEGMELLQELGDMLTDLVSEETREQIENLLPLLNDVVRPAAGNGRWKRAECREKVTVSITRFGITITYEKCLDAVEEQ